MIRSRYSRLVFGTALLAAVVAGVYLSGLLEHISPTSIESWLQPYGMFAPLVFVCMYVIATILLLPATPLTVAAGALFGVWLGTGIVVIGATIGAVAAFLYARFLSQDWSVDKRGTLRSRVAAFETELEKRGFLTVLILRLLPIVPFNVINFALGLTRIKVRAYTVATFVGIIPGTMAYVYFGHSLRMLTWQSILTACVAILLLTLIGWYGKRTLTRTSTSSS